MKTYVFSLVDMWLVLRDSRLSDEGSAAIFIVLTTFKIVVAGSRMLKLGTYALKMGKQKFPSNVGKYLTTLQCFKSQRQ